MYASVFTAFTAGASTERQPPIAVMVNISNSVNELSANQLRSVLLGNLREWPNHRRITIVQREPSSPIVSAVLRSILQMSVSDYNRYLLNLDFKGQLPVPVKSLISDESACSFVFNAPGAIGFLYAESLAQLPCGTQVRILRIIDKPQFSPLKDSNR